MELKMSLALPRDRLTVPIARHVLQRSLDSLGVEPDQISDIELALTEACANVIDHARGEDDYEVTVGIFGRLCVIEVIDRGDAFDGTGLAPALPTAEGGRGVQIMRALMDSLEFHSRPTQGTVVHLEKKLTWTADSPIGKLETSRR